MTFPETWPEGFVERMAALERRRQAARDELNAANRAITAALRQWRLHDLGELTRKIQEDASL